MKNLIDLLERVPLREQWRRIAVGLRAPRDSGERRYAAYALLRMFGPSSISMVGSLLIAAAALCVTIGGHERIVEEGYIEVDLFDPKIAKPLDPPAPEKPQDKVRPEPDFAKNRVQDYKDVPGTGGSGTAGDAPDSFAKKDEPFGQSDGVVNNFEQLKSDLTPVMTKSTKVMRNLFGRTDEERILRLGKWGSPEGGGTVGSDATEGAVLRALRWLKQNQEADGSWKNTRPAMTGLAVLAYLGRNETSASKEFGNTVEKALRWLLDNQEPDGRFKGRDTHDYSHPIAAYALCEAYGMMRLPDLRKAAEKAVEVIIRGQHPSGGWDYNCRQSDRDDTSYMGWCAQALKAASIAGLDNDGLKEALKKATSGFKRNYDSSGRFGYTNGKDGTGGLTGVGVLCLQLLGHGKDQETRNGIMWLEKASFDWKKPWLSSPIYYWYYVTQAKFHAGGSVWNSWNGQFAEQLVRNQKITKAAVRGADGLMHDIGWWEPPEDIRGHTDGVVMDTALCTLQLEVYYRYLPTFQQPKVQQEEQQDNSTDLVIQVSSSTTK